MTLIFYPLSYINRAGDNKIVVNNLNKEDCSMTDMNYNPQDLHDFEDVAENYDLYLDVMYKEQDNHTVF